MSHIELKESLLSEDFKGINLISGKSGSGKSVLLYNIMTLFLRNNKKILFLDGDHSFANLGIEFKADFEKYKDNFQLISSNPENKPLEELIQLSFENNEFDAIFLEEPSNLYRYEDRVLLAGNARYIQGFSTWLSLTSEKPVFWTVMDYSRASGLSAPTGLRWNAMNILQIIKLGESIFNISLAKSRALPPNTQYSFVLKEDFSLIDNPHYDTNFLFGEEIEYLPETYLLHSVKEYMQLSLTEIIIEKFGVSGKKQIRDLKSKIINNTEELKIENVNFNYLNILYLLKTIFKDEFNIDYFMSNFDIKNKEPIRSRRYAGLEDEFEIIIFKFFKENFTFKKAIGFFRKLENEKNLWEALINLSLRYDQVISEIDELSCFEQCTLSQKKIKSKLIKMKSIKQMEDYLKSQSNILKVLKSDNKLMLFEKRMLDLKNKNQINNDFYEMVVPLSIEDLIAVGKHFNNCVKDGFFIEKFLDRNEYLFFLRAKNKIDRDLCVHLEKNKEIIEAKCLNNQIMTEDEENKLFLFIKEITI